MESDNLKKKILGLLLIFLGLIFIVILLIEDINIYTYNSFKEINNQVSLKPNSFYEKDILENKNSYISSSILNYKINFNYSFHENKDYKLNYYYEIKADLVGMVKDTFEEVWTKTFTLKVSDKKESKDFKINEDIVIDYPYYDELAKSFKDTYKVDLDFKLKVRLDIYIELETKEEINDYSELDITLDDKISSVEENNKNIEKEKNNYTIEYLVSIILIILGIILLINKNNNSNSINNYLKEYQDLIIFVKNKPSIKNLKVLNLESFNDLIDIAEQNNTHIIYYEKNMEFYIILGDYIYVFKEEI